MAETDDDEADAARTDVAEEMLSMFRPTLDRPGGPR